MLNRKLLVPVIAFMFTLNVVVPYAVFAQDTEVPPTVEAFPTVAQEPVTIEPQPTAVATEVPGPSPIDPTKVTEGLFSTIIALVAAVVGIAFVGIFAAFFALPPWMRPIVLGIAKNALDEGDKIAATTPTKLDDIGLAELREALTRLEAKQNQTEAQVAVVSNQVASNTQDIAAQTVRAQNVG